MTAISSFLNELSGASGALSLASNLPVTLPFSLDAPFPLAQHVDLPASEVGGELLLDLRHLAVGPIMIEGVRPGPGQNQVSVYLAPCTLTGRYEIYGLEKAAIDVDTGGAFGRLTQQGTLDSGNEAPPITDKQYRYLEKAEQQRVRLLTTTGGQALIDQYNKYGDTYSDVFNRNATMRAHWNKDNATSDMADYTYDALNSGTIVNPDPSAKTFGSAGVGYNYNAAYQQSTLGACCGFYNYDDAGSAILEFLAQVQSTGNTSSNTNSMTGEQVYTTVNSSTTSDPFEKSKRTAVAKMLWEPFKQVASGADTGAARQMLADHGIVFDDETIKAMRSVWECGRQNESPASRLPVWQGHVNTPLDKSHYVFDLTEQPNGAITVKLHQRSLTIPTLALDTAGWSGPLATVASHYLRDGRFMLGILESRVGSALTSRVRSLAARHTAYSADRHI